MATPYTDAYVRYDGNGVTTEFSIDFDYKEESEIKVYLKRGSEEQITVPSADYSFVTKNTLKFPASGSSEKVLAVGDILAIQRESEFSSEYVFDNQRRLEPVEVMNSDDNLERQIQELKRDVGQAIRIQPTSKIDTDEYFKAVESVYENIDDIKIVSGISGEVVVCAENIEAIKDAPNQASAAAQSALEASQSAAESMTSASEAKSSADNAQESLTELKTTATDAFNANAAQKQAAVDASADAAAQSASSAATSANLADIQNKITNCLLKIPQDIKLELNNGTLTLKSGSKVYDGNGLFKAIESDLTLTPSGYADIPHVAFVKEDGMLYARAVIDCASGDTTPSTDLWLYYNTTDKKVYQIENGVNVGTASLPLCVFTVSGGTASKITQVFNGFGYIGNTIFALPNIEGLIPNGRNADGSLNNTKFKTTGVLTLSTSSIINDKAMIRLTNTTMDIGDLIYDDATNYNYNGSVSTENRRNFAIIGTVSTDSTGRITSFNPKQTFQAVDRNEADYIVDSGSSTVGNQTAHYKLFKSGLLIQWGQYISAQGITTVTLPKPFADTSYVVSHGFNTDSTGNIWVPSMSAFNKTTTSWQNREGSAFLKDWMAIGQGATE